MCSKCVSFIKIDDFRVLVLDAFWVSFWGRFGSPNGGQEHQKEVLKSLSKSRRKNNQILIDLGVPFGVPNGAQNGLKTDLGSSRGSRGSQGSILEGFWTILETLLDPFGHPKSTLKNISKIDAKKDPKR